MTPLELKQKAQEAKSLYAAGDISYEEMVAVAKQYIDACNEVAIRIAKEYGMKPKLMSVKAWLR
jgi:hypothetical protein